MQCAHSWCKTNAQSHFFVSFNVRSERISIPENFHIVILFRRKCKIKSTSFPTANADILGT